MTEPITRTAVLASECTHRLVHEVLALCDRCDPVDALNDLWLVREVIKTELERNTR